MTARTIPQNRMFHALVQEVARSMPMPPWRRQIALEAWKRYFMMIYVRDARMEAYGVGARDPFPARVARSRDLEAWQMNELIECTYAHAAQNMGLVLDSAEPAR